MASKINTVFVDTSMFKALIDTKDDFHQDARQIWERFTQERIRLATSNYIFDETLTLLRYRGGLPLALRFRELIIDNVQYIKILRVTTSDEANAWEWFVKDWSKLSFTDCVSFALMTRIELSRVATFDNHFKRAGFLVEK